MAVPLYKAKAEFFRTLGHPVRIRVLELLADGPTTVQELLEDIGVEPSNLSQQLAVLRRTGLVTSEREGNNVRYACSRPEVVDLLAAARLIIRDVRSDQVMALDDPDAPDEPRGSAEPGRSSARGGSSDARAPSGGSSPVLTGSRR